MAVFLSKAQQQKTGGNHSALIVRNAGAGTNSGAITLGTAIYDPARAQFAFVAQNHDLVLTSAEQTELVGILNSLTR